MYKIKQSTQFKKDYKKIINNQKLKSELREILNIINVWKPIPSKYKDHKLKWDYKTIRECHIRPDFLLVYEINNDELILLLLRLWSHSEIF